MIKTIHMDQTQQQSKSKTLTNDVYFGFLWGLQ